MTIPTSTCSGLPCPTNSEEAVCIQKLCLCENSLRYNTTQQCDNTRIKTPYPLRQCDRSDNCQKGLIPLAEHCINSRCLVACKKNSDCRQSLAVCVAGLCMCNYGMVMSAKGCAGLQYVPPPDLAAGPITVPVLGFWAYAAIIGGFILGSAVILVVIHALCTVRPARLETLMRLTQYPELENPFAPKPQPSPTLYSNSRQSTLSGMVEKGYNLKADSDRKKMGNLVRNFSSKHPELAKRLNNPETRLSPVASSDSDTSLNIPSDRLNSHYSTPPTLNSKRMKRKVTWTPSTHLGSSEDDSDEINQLEFEPLASSGIPAYNAQENNRLANMKKNSGFTNPLENTLVDDRRRVSSLSTDRRRSSSFPSDRRRSSVVQNFPEDLFDMGLGRVGNRLSIIR